MARRTDDAAVAAASAASEAARVLQQRSQEVRSESRSEARAESHTLTLPKREPTGDSAPPKAVEKTGDPSAASEAEEAVKKMPRGNAYREGVMEEIRADREARAKEGAQAPPEPVAQPETPAAPADQQPAPGAEALPATGAAPTPATVETVRVKVDGEEFDAPKADVDEAGGIGPYQRERAADNRLKKANESLAETRRVQAQITAWAQQQAQAAQPREPVVTDDQFIASKMDLIRFGTPEEGAAAMREVLQRTSVNQAEIVTQATASMRYDMAKAQFNRDYNDVLANPLVQELVASMERRAMANYVQNGRVNWQSMAQVDFSQHFNTIGTQVRNLVGRPSQPATVPAAAGAVPASGNPSSVSPDREARKASIVEPPKATALRAVVAEDEKPETREEGIRRMKRSRGLPVD